MKEVRYSDKFQQDYVYYRSEPVGKNFDPTFKSELTPKEMLEIGVFGGLYFTDKPSDLPRNWFTKAKLSPDKKRHKELNYFNVNASQSLKE